MGDTTHLLKVLLVVTLAICGTSEVTGVRKCAQCVAARFWFHRWLFQQSSIGQAMGWVDRWERTDCITGEINVIPCNHSCLIIELQRRRKTGFTDEGVLMECADDLIHGSVDLPKYVDYKVFNEDAKYLNIRAGFKIIHTFTTEGFKSVEDVVKYMEKFDFPSDVYTRKRLSYKTVLYVTLAITVLWFVANCFKNCWYARKKNNTSKKKVHFENKGQQVRIELD